MEIKNGIVINGEFHEAIKVNEQVISCNDCSLKPIAIKLWIVFVVCLTKVTSLSIVVR